MSDFVKARTAMVDCQVRPSDVTLYPIIDAMLAVRRELFVPQALRGVAYSDEMVDLGEGRFVLAPRCFAKMLNALSITQSDLVLDIGCGLGYSAAVLAHMAEAVVGLEAVESLASEAQQTLLDEAIHNVVIENRALAEGSPSHGPYDVIIVEGGIEQLPDTLVQQLKQGGRIAAIMVDGAMGRMMLGIRRGDLIAWRAEFDVTVPVLEGFLAEKAFQF